MKKIAILVVMAVPDETTDEQLGQVVAAVSAQVDDPIGGYDESGNDQVIEGTSNTVTLFGEQALTALLAGAEVGLEGVLDEDWPGAVDAWDLLTTARSL